MPKKTRKQKLLTDTRKQTRDNNPSQTYSYTASHGKSPPTKQSATLIAFDISDVRKTIILGFIFITAEILLAVYSPKMGW